MDISGRMTSAMRELLLRSLRRHFGDAPLGTLHISFPSGVDAVVGGGGAPRAHWQIRNWRTLLSLYLRGELGLGESFVWGHWSSPDPEQLYQWFIRNMARLPYRQLEGHALVRWLGRFNHNLLRRNSLRGSRRNIAAHYDVGNRFYRLWLDPSMTYSSALFRDRRQTLYDAQQSKYARLLDAVPDGNILEIGCGWGGFMAHARGRGRHVHGITLSRAQRDYVRRTQHGAQVALCDYRHCRGQYNALVSIEMFEAVGARYWPLWFAVLRDRLRRHGMAALQFISINSARHHAYLQSNDFIRTHVFPGGSLASVPVFKQHARAAGLAVADELSFGQSYTATLRQWLARLDARREDIMRMGFDGRALRCWQIYLAMCAAGFATGHVNVHQIMLARVR